jgi:hypothetical protein
MNKWLYELSLRALAVARTIHAGLHLLPALGALVVILLMTRYFGLNIFTLVLALILVAMVTPAVIIACEIYTKPSIEKAEDRRIYLATSRRARRAALHRPSQRDQSVR